MTTLKKFFLFFLILIISTLSTTAYDEVGEDDEYAGNTLFINSLTELSSLSEQGGIGTPLVADLDNDGESEIVTFTDALIRIYQASPPVLLASFDVQSTKGGDFAHQQPIIIDTDLDGVKEVIILALDIVHPGAGSAWVYQHVWNGTGLASNAVAEITGLPQTLDQGVITCAFNPALQCVAIMADGLWFNSYIRIMAFNMSVQGTLFSHYTDTANHDMACLPSINHVEYEDWDNDGSGEFIFSWLEVGPASRNEIYHLDAIQVNGSFIITADDSISEDVGSYISDATPDCRASDYTTGVTAPYVANIDDISSNGQEAVIGHLTEADSFKMISFTSVGGGSEFDDYPEGQSILGTALGNIVEMDVFAESGRVDFCVTSKDTDLNITFLCASEQIGEILGFGDSDIFSGDMPYAPSFTHGRNDHKIQAATRPDGTDVILSLYGTHVLTDSDDSHALDFQISENDISVVFAQVDGSNQNDIVGVTGSNLWYFDDGFLSGCDENGCIDEIFYNPCFEQTWRLNSSVEIRTTVTDVDGTDVGVRVILYEGDSNEQDSGWSANQTSGTTFTTSFSGNKTITNGNIVVQARAVANPISVEEKTSTFSVGLAGIVFNEVTCTDDFTVENVTSVITQDSAIANNAIDTAVQDIHDETGVGSTIVWYIVMGMAALSIWFGAREMGWDGGTTLGLLVFMEVLLTIVGVTFGYLSFGILVVIVMAGLLVAAFGLRKIITGHGG